MDKNNNNDIKSKDFDLENTPIPLWGFFLFFVLLSTLISIFIIGFEKKAWSPIEFVLTGGAAALIVAGVMDSLFFWNKPMAAWLLRISRSISEKGESVQDTLEKALKSLTLSSSVVSVKVIIAVMLSSVIMTMIAVTLAFAAYDYGAGGGMKYLAGDLTGCLDKKSAPSYWTIIVNYVFDLLTVMATLMLVRRIIYSRLVYKFFFVAFDLGVALLFVFFNIFVLRAFSGDANISWEIFTSLFQLKVVNGACLVLTTQLSSITSFVPTVMYLSLILFIIISKLLTLNLVKVVTVGSEQASKQLVKSRLFKATATFIFAIIVIVLVLFHFLRLLVN